MYSVPARRELVHDMIVSPLQARAECLDVLWHVLV